MKNINSIEDSIFFKQNMKIKKNMWKTVTIVLLLSILVVFTQGIN